jgi:C1A family cysteine protease
VAFATTALLEASIMKTQGASIDLSEQYVFYVARLNDPDLSEDGTYPNYALDGLQQRGACAEWLWPYNPYDDWGQALTFSTPTRRVSVLDADAQRHRIAGYSSLTPTDVQALKQALADGNPVAIGVAFFNKAWFNHFTDSTGEVLMPITRARAEGTETLYDTIDGGHEILLTGYHDTPDENDVANYRPGGGYFDFKNSWGTDWARANLNGWPGFGRLPYAYVAKYNTDASVIT